MTALTPTGTGVRHLSPGLVGVAAVVGCVALGQLETGDEGRSLCPTNAILGLDCPLCGMTRSVAALGRLDPLAALDHNLLIAALVPLSVLAWWGWASGRRLALRMTPTRWWTVGLALVAFTVLRNLPFDGVPGWLAATA